MSWVAGPNFRRLAWQESARKKGNEEKEYYDEIKIDCGRDGCCFVVVDLFF